jgi:hypothetical protein
MTDKEYQSLPQPDPPIGFPAEAPPDFAVPHEVTKFQRGGKKLIRAIRKRLERTREADAVSSARRS